MSKIGICLYSEYLYPFADAPEEPDYCDLLSFGYRAMPYVGLDYIEVGVQRMMQLSAEQLRRLRDEGVQVYAGNGFLPKELRVVEMKPELEKYVCESMRRMAMFGAKYVVFGSGGARNMDEGMSEREKQDALIRFLRICDKYAGEHGITVVIEPLAKRGSNVINSVYEGYLLAKEADLPNVRLLADEEHMYNETDREKALDDLETVAPILLHTHVRDVNNGLWPGNSDTDYIARFASRLKKIGYTGGVSFECGYTKLPDDLRTGIGYMRSLLDN